MTKNTGNGENFGPQIQKTYDKFEFYLILSRLD